MAGWTCDISVFILHILVLRPDLPQSLILHPRLQEAKPQAYILYIPQSSPSLYVASEIHSNTSRRVYSAYCTDNSWVFLHVQI